MSKFRKNLIIFLDFLIYATAVIAILGFVIFIFDMNESKGILPIVFFSIFVYFLSNFLIDMIERSVNRKLRLDITKLLFFICFLVIFILSLYIFWI